MARLRDYSLTKGADVGGFMTNETIGRIVGSFIGAALIVAGMAAFGPRAGSEQDRTAGTSVAALHFADWVTVQGKAD